MLARTKAKQKLKEENYLRLLNLEQDLNKQYYDAIKDFYDGKELDIKTLPPEKPDPNQLLQDMVYQKRLFLDNAKTIMNSNEAQRLLDDYTNDDNTIRWFNKFFKEIESRLKNKDSSILTKDYVFNFVKELKSKLGEIGITDLTAEQIENITRRPEDIDTATNNEPAVGSTLANQQEFLVPAQKAQAWNRIANPYPRDTAQNRRKHELANWLMLWTKDSVKKWIASLIPTNRYTTVFGMGVNKTNFNKLDNQPLLEMICNRFVIAQNNYYVESQQAGYGLKKKNYHNRRHMIGKGLSPSQSDKYKEFGKFIIHIPSLKKGILNIKFKSQASIPKIPQVYICQDTMDFLFDLINSGNFDKKAFSKLPENEQSLLKKIWIMADLDDSFNIEHKIDEPYRKRMKRFEIVKDAIIAGNNSEELLKELEEYIYIFIKDGQMSKEQGNSILEDIQKIIKY